MRVIILALRNCATVVAVLPPITHTSAAAAAYTRLHHELRVFSDSVTTAIIERDYVLQGKKM